MRIISGTARGRLLAGPKHDGLRPTSDRVRQVLFDLLGQRFDGGAVLDLYCGSGALALEALSRGAATALAVDSDPRAVALAQANAQSLGFGDRVDVRRMGLPAALAALPRTPRRLIFADPPYEGASAGLSALRHWVGEGELLEPGGVLVIETSKQEAAAAVEPLELRLALYLERQIGDTLLRLYQRTS